MRLTRFIAATLAASTLITLPALGTSGVASAVATPAPTLSAAFPQALSAHEAPHADMIVWRVNQLRASLGLSPVVRVAELDAVAQNWSEYMAATGVFDHRPGFADYYPGGWRRASENVAMRQSSSDDDAGTELYLQWENSPGHYANMIDPDTNAIGVGISYNPSTRSWYGTQNFASYPDQSHLTVVSSGSVSSGSSPSVDTSITAPSWTGDASSTAPAPQATPSPSETTSASETTPRNDQGNSAGAEASQSAPNQAQSHSDRPQSQPQPQVKGTQYIQPVEDVDTTKKAPSAAGHMKAPSGLSATGLQASFVGVALIILASGALLLTLRRQYAHR